MNDLLNIIITTYDSGDGRRIKLLEETIWALILKLRYGNVHFIVTDDSVPDVHNLNRYIIESIFIAEDKSYQMINTNRSGVGFAKNNALKIAFETSPLVLLMEDDWLLKEPLDMHPYMQLLSERSEFSTVRFGFLGGTMNASLIEYNDRTYWKLERGSGVYIYSGQVSLRHRRFYSTVGWHNEELPPGEEELDMCKRFNACDNCGDILWHAEFGSTLNAGPFINIGLDSSTNAVQP